MGAPFRLIEWKLRPIDVVVDGLTSITIAPDGPLEYENQKVILYIRDPKGSIPKYHVVDCWTLRNMRGTGRGKRYVVTRRTDGEFVLNSPPGNLDLDKPKTYRLDICLNCLSKLRYNCASNAFPLASWFEAIGDDYEPPPTDGIFGPQISYETAPPSSYPPDWKLLSLECRERAGWKCEKCGIDLKFQNRFLHAHHKWSVGHNRPEDLQALCIGCHAEQYGHGHRMLRNSPDYTKFMNILGHTWKHLSGKQ